MDLLARLGASAVGLTASVKPIIPPLFLPTPHTIREATASAASTTGERLQEPSSLDVPEHERPATSHWRLREEPPLMRAAEPDPRAADDVPRRSQQTYVPATAEVRAQAVPDRIGIAVDGARLHPLADALADRRSVRDPAPIRAPIASAIATTDTMPHERTAPAQQVDAAPTPRGRERERESDRPALLLTPASPDRQPPDGTATVLDRLRSLRESAPVPVSARSPVVRVTIGRIEVRSAPAAAPEPVVEVVRAPVPAYTPPRLTLEQYLSRNGAGR